MTWKIPQIANEICNQFEARVKAGVFFFADVGAKKEEFRLKLAKV